MKRLLNILLCVILLVAGSSAIADSREVGGDTVEEAVSRMQGFNLEKDENGMIKLGADPELTEYFLQSENQLVILPNVMLTNNGVVIQAMIVAVGGSKLEQVTKVVVETDKKQYTITPEKPYTYSNEKKQLGMAWIADENLDTMIEDMGTSEYIALEFIQDESTHIKITLDEEQLYLMHQYFYVTDNFFLPSETNALGKEFLVGLIKAQAKDALDYSISTTEK